MEDRLDPASQVLLLAPSLFLGLDLLFLCLSWPYSYIVFNSRTSLVEKDSSELLLEPLESLEDLEPKDVKIPL